MVAARRLILIRHSLSGIEPDVPVARWHLSAEGRERARAFAARIQPGTADRVFSSDEPKAIETAQALGAAWGLAVETAPGLHEHLRPQPRILPREEFEDCIRNMFARPSAIVFGAETAAAAADRFESAVLGAARRAPGDIVIVSHGTVIALYVSKHTGTDAFACWKRQEMPFAVTFVLPWFRLDRITFLDREDTAP